MFLAMLRKTILQFVQKHPHEMRASLISFIPARAIFLCMVLLCPAVHAANTAPLAGQYSLQGGTPLTDGYLRLSQIGTDPLKQRIDLWMTLPKSTAPIRTYAVEMTKKLHMVVVSSDFSIFLHIHPELNASGHFLLDQEFPRPGVLLHLR